MLKSARLAILDSQMVDILIVISGGKETNEIENGIYLSPGGNFGHRIANQKEEWVDFKFEDTWFGPFGVCDNIEQVKFRYAYWLNHPSDNYCISFMKVVKSEQSPDGGWRWHKWGEYIGTKEPQCEYLYDEGEEIESVLCYHIFKLLD